MNDPDDWALPDEDYRFSLGIHPGNSRDFFGHSPDRDRLLAERRYWLSDNPQRYVAASPDVEQGLAETESLAHEWGIDSPQTTGDPFNRLLELGKRLEPDLVFMKPDALGELKVVGGCVCFPSFWRLSDKLGLPMSAVHEPVPGLNRVLGSSIQRYLSQLKPGSCWFRANWGLASCPDLNEHPDRGRHPWKRPISLEQVWIRREDQAILPLPESRGILFGIRVVVRSVAEIAQSPDKRQHLLRGLQTMPLDMVRYKGISEIQQDLISILQKM